MKKYIFLDFNGTIIDDIDLCLALLNQVLRKQGHKEVTKEEYKKYIYLPCETIL